MGNAKYAATRLTMSLGVAVLAVMITVVPVASASSPDVPQGDRTALILGGTAMPTPNDYWVEAVRNQYIEPTHPRQNIQYVPVTTPEEFWPITGLFRLIGLGLSAVDPQHWPPELLAAFFPDEPLWKLAGLFDLTTDQSVQAGVADLEAAMTKYGNDHLMIDGYSQGANIAVREKRKLAEQYPAGTTAPDIEFVLGGDGNLPNGGLLARFPGLYIPILDLSFNGPEPTDTQFDTIVITRQYDGWADFPLYPLNLVADLNALLGFFFVHTDPFDVSLAPDPTTPPPIHSRYGDTDYYFFPTDDLPLFAPLRILGVPEPLIDVVEPFFRVLVELSYDRSIPRGEPTPARLIPPLNPVKVTSDLVSAVGEGITNAAAVIGVPALLSLPTAPATSDQDAAMEQNFSGSGTNLYTVSREAGDGVSRVMAAIGSPPEPFAVSQDDQPASQREVDREPPATNSQITGAVKSVIGNGRPFVRSPGTDKGSQTATASPAHKTPVRDAVIQAGSNIRRAVSNVSDSIEQAADGAKDDGNDGDSGEGAAP